MHIRSIYLCVCVCILGSSLSLLCFVSFFFLSERERERVRYTDQKQNKKTWLKKRRKRKSKREGNEDPRAGGMVIMMILYPCPTPHALRHEEGPLRRRTHHVRIRPKQKKKERKFFFWQADLVPLSFLPRHRQEDTLISNLGSNTRSVGVLRWA